ncbi:MULTISPECIES: toluene tolerance protein [unclassified Methylophaga]|jgi:tRNA A-37 threonylcarbamoyl transferase component Bud32|uniref:toluene tolerance protein n=1 Tax=unclassified Methylophaga TaxID=2629249 RepID=UPI000C8916E9|nr:MULTISPECIES: toluene tolerance protein [unclassified Methylophaga]MAK67797.1 toluene tolerance protein [Methylophaga sp.]MAY18478.1 toluene tolerance protein [Methylophaga sp.]MBN45893.1 toluene tolerance protein [Methylophaga sp.]HAO24011.1 toluene tolerance protein [Methylophaga sp.]HCD04975.1 toluene tolerance protein [Methylophaga sp.]|tara:strand:- start:12592 stop:13254 length:663 start_codon:yes stop_codon:yes gene_type:complete
MLNIRPLSAEHLATLMETATVIEKDKKGPKVAVLADGQFLKFFYRKRFFNRELLAPAAVKFARNAHQLEQLDIPTLKVKALHRIVGESHTVAIYSPLAGRTLRDIVKSNEADANLMYRLGVFLALVQRRGIYFRSIHPGNIIVNEMDFGLIDILDMRFQSWSLSRWARRRNWRHFFRYPQEWVNHGDLIEALIKGYRHSADLPLRELSWIDRIVGRVIST